MSLLTPNYSNTHLHQELPPITPSNRCRYCQRQRLIISHVGGARAALKLRAFLRKDGVRNGRGCEKVDDCHEFSLSVRTFTFTVARIKVEVKGMHKFVVFMR